MADDDIEHLLNADDASTHVEQAVAAFTAWESVERPMANDYLVSLLFRNRTT